MNLRPLLIAALLGIATSAAATPIHDRMTLVEAIEALRDLDFDIIYSSQLVEEWMLVRSTPAEEDPIAALRSVLAVYDLDIVAGPGERWLIVAGELPSNPPPSKHDDDLFECRSSRQHGVSRQALVIVL